MTKKINDKLRQKTEVFSRVNGYLRPVSQYNDAKQAEFADRKPFKLNQ